MPRPERSTCVPIGTLSSRPQCYAARSHAPWAASALLMQDERAAEERQRYEAQAAAAREEADRVAAEQQFEPQDITEEQRLRFVRTRVQLVKGVLSESDIAELMPRMSASRHWRCTRQMQQGPMSLPTQTWAA